MNTPSRRPVPTRYATRPRTQPPIDRLANWLATRSRPLRILIALLISGALTISVTVFLFGLLSGADPNRLPGSADTFVIILLIVSLGAGIAFYWVGWRVMLGFDFEDQPLRPGRAAAWWLIAGIVLLILTLFGVFSSTLSALS